jgi:hypothetical protein
MTDNEKRFIIHTFRTKCCNLFILGGSSYQCSDCPIVPKTQDWCSMADRNKRMLKIIEEHPEEFVEILLED